MSIRPIKRLARSKPTLEGAGVHLRRAFGFGNTTEFDPFLLLDDFRNDVPEDYLAGFPWHPHRGIETITYVLAGTVEHGDSMGNRGAIASGDVQWMTAGSGIIHQEMPKGDAAGPDARVPVVGQPAGVAQDDGAAIPGSESRRDPRDHRRRWHARPRGLRQFLGQARSGGRDRGGADLPGCVGGSGAPEELAGGDHAARVRLCFRRGGEVLQRLGPAGGAHRRGGVGRYGASHDADNRSLVVFDSGDEVTVQAGDEGIRFLLVSGKPIEEPVAWYGPIVMNTQEQLQQAFQELEKGTFLKK